MLLHIPVYSLRDLPREMLTKNGNGKADSCEPVEEGGMKRRDRKLVKLTPVKNPFARKDHMPLTSKGSKILSGMDKKYGAKKGKEVFARQSQQRHDLSGTWRDVQHGRIWPGIPQRC